MHIKAVILHFETTLIQTEFRDPAAVRSEIGCPAEMPILDYIRGLASTADRKRVLAALDDYEQAAAAAVKPAVGAEAVVGYLEQKKVRVAIVSGNSGNFVRKMLDELSFINQPQLGPVLNREDLLSRPDAADPVELAAGNMRMPLEQVMVVAGDPQFLQMPEIKRRLPC